MTSTKTSDAPGVVSDAIVRQLAFFSGIPAEDGYYIIELDQPGLCDDRPYDIDYCRAKSASDGGGREWVKWYPHNVRRWARLPNDQDQTRGTSEPHTQSGNHPRWL